jgi:hypothetical protein
MAHQARYAKAQDDAERNMQRRAHQPMQRFLKRRKPIFPSFGGWISRGHLSPSFSFLGRFPAASLT